jgi:hypothetical protein
LSLCACGHKSPEIPAEPEQTVELPQDFIEFYELFHTDTNYQLSHIAFPLSGKPASGQFNMQLTDFKWTRDGWRIHKRMSDDDDTFDKKYIIYSEDMIAEIIFSPTYGYYMERRFGKLSDGWNLIYYADMQEGGEESE